MHITLILLWWFPQIINFNKGVVLPNIGEIHMSLNGVWKSDVAMQNATVHTIRDYLSPSMFPALKKLEIKLVHEGDSRGLAFMWPCLTNLEEIIFLEGDKCTLEDVAFMGFKGERPFLHLTSK